MQRRRSGAPRLLLQRFFFVLTPSSSGFSPDSPQFFLGLLSPVYGTVAHWEHVGFELVYPAMAFVR